MNRNDTQTDNSTEQSKWERERLSRARSDSERRKIKRQHDIAQTHWSDWTEGRYE